MDNIDKIIKYSHGIKLLYVEDNKEARESTQMILEEFFDDIVFGVDGEDGFNKFNTHDIDLIITDINMPKLNGLDMIAKIRKESKDIPILVLSAYNESGFFMDSIKLGVEGYLLKPIDINQFMNVLERVIEKLELKNEIDKNIHFLKEYQDMTNESSIVSKTDLKGIITFVNEQFCNISGYSKEELVGKNHNIVRHPDMAQEAFRNMWDTIKNKKQTWNGIVKNLGKSGKTYYVNATVKPILDINGEIIEYIALRNDITNIMNPKKQLNDAIKNIKDPLVIYMKLEDFDMLEEFYDNTMVEQIEDKITKYLEQYVLRHYQSERIYQLGNGEYAMINEKDIWMQDEDKFINDLKIFQDSIKDSVVDIGDIMYNMSIMISIAYDKKQVLESAKLGIRELLNTKQNFIISNNFAQRERDKAKRNMETISLIKTAIKNSKIVSYFQPIVDNKTKEIAKYESLVRLINEEGEVLSPFFFLDISKRGKYYSQITHIVLDKSFDALKNTDKDISINLSALDIEMKTTRDKLFGLLDKNKQYASRIVIELLEDENVKDIKLIWSFITTIKKLGVKIAIDDFGAGYSNFERLLDYQPDILKIDGCLIRDIETNSYSHSVVKTIVSFAKEQNIQIVAEYVENEKIFNILKDIGVDYSQGYYFGKPETLSYYEK